MPVFEEKFEWMIGRYDELMVASAQPDIIADLPRWQNILREIAQLEPAVTAWRDYVSLRQEIASAEELLEQPDYTAIAEEELALLRPRQEAALQELKVFLLPRDPNDDKNVVMEIRAGAGGDEAGLFGAMLMRMYVRYAERHGYTTTNMSISESELGGVKEAVFMISGNGAFSRLKYESGVHRVQRVPVTESSGRIHTSTATVAVLPEADEVDVEINPGDLRIDTYRASGHGGQYINMTDSAIRITHLPSGLVVTCQDEKSQLKNKEQAMRVLRARLYEKMQAEADAEYSAHRRDQIGTGDRSERIRTYNFPQGRVTDHRIGLTLYRINDILDGDLDEIIDALIMEKQAENLREAALNE
ncbi:MAG: peptide chain release factor 1 [Christensenellales bacterium]|jgi:peptide chain release factor 1